MRLVAWSLAIAGMMMSVSAQAADRVVNFYNWSNYMAPGVLEEFTKETGIKVVYDTFDANETALFGILAEWNSSRSYASRVANLRGAGTGSAFANRLNGNFFLTTEGPNATVLDDGAVDVVSGSGGLDWYLVNTDGSNIDKITDLSAGERVDDVEV